MDISRLMRGLSLRSRQPDSRNSKIQEHKRTRLLGGGSGASKVQVAEGRSQRAVSESKAKATSVKSRKARSKSDLNSNSDQSVHANQVQDIFEGARIQCKDFYTSKKTGKKVFKWRDAKVIEVAKGKVKISYDGFDSKWDEWITFTSRSSCRLRAIDGEGAVRFENIVYVAPITASRDSVRRPENVESASFVVEQEFGLPSQNRDSNTTGRRGSKTYKSRRESKEELKIPHQIVNNSSLLVKSRSHYHVNCEEVEEVKSETGSHTIQTRKSDSKVSKAHARKHPYTSSKSTSSVFQNMQSNVSPQSTVFTGPKSKRFDILAWAESYRVSGRQSEIVRGVCGLRNQGNTCFLNAVVQCLAHIAPLVQYFVQDPKRYRQEIHSRSATKGGLANSLASLLVLQWSTRQSNDSPRLHQVQANLKQNIEILSDQFYGNAQHDAQELYLVLLDGLHEDLSRIKVKPKYEEIQDNCDLTDIEKSELWWNNYEERNDSILKDLFCGQLQSKVTCATCGHSSTSYDPFWDLSVPIPSAGHQGTTLEACLEEFTDTEQLEGDEQYYCKMCKSHCDSSKSIGVFRCPVILVIHLKRTRSNSGEKVNTMVHFPVENLNIKDFCTNPASKCMKGIWYDLICVVNHHGKTTSSGHYTADCFNPDDWQWYCFDDRDVRQISNQNFNPVEAYLLFYIRRSA